MSDVRKGELPSGHAEDRELLLDWLAFLREAVLRKTDGLDENEVRWRPEGRLISLLGIINHLTHVEWRWIDGGFRNEAVTRSEEEFVPDPGLTLENALGRYRARAASTESFVRSVPTLRLPCARQQGTDLRWVLLHLINETARHAGHADAVRELLDGVTGD
ncbi:MAG: hypothetical protein JWM85_1747 [Acidimicrobiaceae bacterium]|nr:hypothetical protein [Acidimicrobiaceae bacterium]